MVMLGLDDNIDFDGELKDAWGEYKEILMNIDDGEEIDKDKWLIFNRSIVRLLTMQGLNDEELDMRDVFIDKCFSLLDVVFALDYIRRNKDKQ